MTLTLRTKVDTVLDAVFLGSFVVILFAAMLEGPFIVARDGFAGLVPWIPLLLKWWLVPILAAYAFWDWLQSIELSMVHQQAHLSAERLARMLGSIAVIVVVLVIV